MTQRRGCNGLCRHSPARALPAKPWCATRQTRRSSGCGRHRYQTNERQRKVLERLLEAGHVGSGGGFLGGMTTDKYAKITGTSKATATRDLVDLADKGLLRIEGVGKATRYAVNVPGWEQPEVKG